MFVVYFLIYLIWPFIHIFLILFRFRAGATDQRRYGKRKCVDAQLSTQLSFGRYNTPKPEWVRNEIIYLKALMSKGDDSCRKIADTFNRSYASSKNMTVGKTYVSNVIRNHLYEIEVLKTEIKHKRPKPVPKNLIWAMDLTGKADAQKNTHYILGIVEHRSRQSLCLEGVKNKSSTTLLRCLLNFIEKFGKPKIIRTANEAIFTSSLFTRTLKFLGIRHQRIKPHSPWQNGRGERFFGTLKEKLDQWQVESFEQLNLALGQFQVWYNHIRPHQNLDGRTPGEVWNGVDIFKRKSKDRIWFEAWDELLTGFYIPP